MDELRLSPDRIQKRVMISLVIFLTASSLCAQTFTDGTFTNTSWTETLLTNISAAGANATATQYLTDGIPLPSRITTHNYPTGQIFVAHLSTSSTYDPSSQGEIVNLSYSYDLRHYTDGAVAYSLLVFQNGTYYNTTEDYIKVDKWTHFANPSLTAASFTKLDGPAGMHPDFSCKGAHIAFGFVTRNSNPTSSIATTKSAIDNWTVTIVDKRQCCAAVSAPKVSCDHGIFTYTFTVTNQSPSSIQYVLLSPPVGATYTISPNVVNLGTNPLSTGQFTTVNVVITNASPGDTICINVALADSEIVACCTMQTCVVLPHCPCLRSGDAIVACAAAGTYTYTVTLLNLTGVPVQQIFVAPTIPSNLSVSPQLVTLSTPLLPNQTTTITMTLSGAPAGTHVCLRFSPLGDNRATCCSIEVCLDLPECIPDRLSKSSD